MHYFLFVFFVFCHSSSLPFFYIYYSFSLAMPFLMQSSTPQSFHTIILRLYQNQLNVFLNHCPLTPFTKQIFHLLGNNLNPQHKPEKNSHPLSIDFICSVTHSSNICMFCNIPYPISLLLLTINVVLLVIYNNSLPSNLLHLACLGPSKRSLIRSLLPRLH